jgi:hypothetical protein
MKIKKDSYRDALLGKILLIYDIIFGTEAQDLPGMIMMIDFEKAFNTLQF